SFSLRVSDVGWLECEFAVRRNSHAAKRCDAGLRTTAPSLCLPKSGADGVHGNTAMYTKLGLNCERLRRTGRPPTVRQSATVTSSTPHNDGTIRGKEVSLSAAGGPSCTHA